MNGRNFKKQIRAFHELADARKVPVRKVDPLVFRFIRSFGIMLKPPMFLSRGANVMIFMLTAIGIALLLTVMAYSVDSDAFHQKLFKIFVILNAFAFVLGLVGGFCFAMYHYMLRRKLNIPPWKDVEIGH